jgi:hypothetical protein
MDRTEGPHSIADATPPADPRFVADGWSLSLPEGWHNETVYHLDGPTVQGTTVRVVIHVDPDIGDVGVADYAHVRIERLRASTRTARILDRNLERLDEDRSAYRCRVLVPAPETTRLNDHVYLVESGTGYELTVTVPRIHYPQFRPVVDWMIRSFEPKSPFREQGT